MLQSIHLRNFFSFDDTKIDLHPSVNMLIGINGSGKSNFLKALKLIKEGVSGKGYREVINSDFGGYTAMYNFTNPDSLPIELTFEFDRKALSSFGYRFDRNLFYQLQIKRSSSTQNFYLSERIHQLPKPGYDTDWIFLNVENGKGTANEAASGVQKLVRYDSLDGQETALKSISDPDRYGALYALRNAISSINSYEIFDTRQKSKLRQPMLSTSSQRLDPEGDNLPQILNTININQKEDYREIKKLLQSVNSGYSDINFNHIGPNIELMLEESNLNKAVHVVHISDGTLQFLCLLAILNNRQAGQLISIDEPEVRLHPDMINVVADCINSCSITRQLFVATHSEYLLNSFGIENIRVFQKTEKNCTEVKSFSDSDFEGWYEQYSVGQMWRKNDFGGNT
jgi:predicted ATPase